MKWIQKVSSGAEKRVEKVKRKDLEVKGTTCLRQLTTKGQRYKPLHNRLPKNYKKRVRKKKVEKRWDVMKDSFWNLLWLNFDMN
jgi:hypothetical protein